MNRGLKYYGIMLIMIATLVFTLNDFEIVNATTSVNQNNSTQINPLNELISDSSGISTCNESRKAVWNQHLFCPHWIK